jgi:MFS transporter, putative metabolite:H+ symporter
MEVDKRHHVSIFGLESWVWIAVLVAGLGYFVDVVDLWLFSNFRVASLLELGLTQAQVTTEGVFLLNCQQVGLLLGGITWGILGDKRGRASVMFGSILLYSIGNILNAFIVDVHQYAILRFLTGLGLAGEIGAGITLVCEILPKDKRGIGTTFVTGLGVAGAIFAALMGKYLDWRTAYFVGGVMGLALLFLRIFTHDSGMFERMRMDNRISKGSLRLLFGRPQSLICFFSCVAAGAPIYLTFAIFASLSPEVAPAFGVAEPVVVPEVMLAVSIGMTAGDVFAGGLSQLMRSRKIPLLLLIALTGLVAAMIVSELFPSRNGFLILVGLLGLFSGYWACLITTSSEQFGTNIRATVTTMVPNLIRATAIVMTTLFVYLQHYTTVRIAVITIVVGVFSVALLGVSRLKETFSRDLNFYEEC